MQSLPRFLGVITAALALILTGCSVRKIPTATDESPSIGFNQPPQDIDTEPSWNPAGTALVYVHFVNEPIPSQLRILDIATGAISVIGYGWDPKWSPDGTKIASVIYGTLQVYNLTTQTWTPLRQDGRSYFASWSWDSKTLVFELAPLSYGEVGLPGGIYLFDVASGELTNAVPQLGTWPCYAPGDSELVFANSYPRDGTPMWEEIAKFSFKTGKITRLTDDVYDNRDLAVSPDGTRIAWFGWSGSKTIPSGIYVSPLVGGTAVLVDTLGQGPAWSPDGTQLAYAGYNRESRSYTLWTMNADGSGKRRLTAP